MRITAPFLLALSLSLLALPPHACGQLTMAMEGYGGEEMYGGGGMGDMGMGMMGNMPKQPQVRYVILLSPDFDTSKSPFTDAYELVATTNNFIQLEQVRIDLSTPLPTKPGISVHARYPKEMDENELAKWKQQVKLDAFRFGIADVQYSPIDSLNGDSDSDTNSGSTFVSVRIGVQSGVMPPGGINKYASAALSLDPKQPQVELFDQSRLRSETDAQDDSGAFGMDGGGYGGVTVYSRVMQGMGDYGGMGAGEGYSYGKEDATPKPTPAASEGTIHGNGLILSWSLEQGYASAIGTSAGGRWMQVKLNGERIVLSEQQMQARIESNHQSALKLQDEIKAAANQYAESADEAEQQPLELRLLELVHRAFDLRSEKQFLELAVLESKIKTLSQQMQLRQTKRDEIARAQVKQLTGSK